MVGEPQYRREPRPGKLTAFHEALQQALKVDGHRPKRERRTAQALYAQIKAAGYPGAGRMPSVRAKRIPRREALGLLDGRAVISPSS